MIKNVLASEEAKQKVHRNLIAEIQIKLAFTLSYKRCKFKIDDAFRFLSTSGLYSRVIHTERHKSIKNSSKLIIHIAAQK